MVIGQQRLIRLLQQAKSFLLFNYLVPMLQDKRAEEEETEGEALGLST